MMLKMEMVAENKRCVLSLFWAGVGFLGLCPGPCSEDRLLGLRREADPFAPAGPHLDFPKHKCPRPSQKLPALVAAAGKLMPGVAVPKFAKSVTPEA